MRILHTADWHLGQRFNGNDRHEEHQCFLDWLLMAIEEQNVDALVVAGDIFDTANPGPTAQRQYYTFLAKLSKSTVCRDVVIVGGNHDNPHLLNAPNQILKALSIHVVGAVPQETKDQCISLPSGEATKLVVAAVPFLRDSDIRKSALGLTLAEQDSRIRQGIAEHYAKVADCVRHNREKGIPVLATGHLFAQGCEASKDSERTIHIGTLGQVSAEVFSGDFDYVALGHLHRHQKVGGKEHIRYSGSPIPLSFPEVAYGHQVLLLDFEGAQNPKITALAIPCTRKLLRIKGSLDEVEKELRGWQNEGFLFPAWAEAVVAGEPSSIRVNDLLDQLNEELEERVIVVSRKTLGLNAADTTEDSSADPLENILKDPSRVFARLLDLKGYEEDSPARQQLMRTYMELLSFSDEAEAQ